jgi:TP901 family phage tail tape measure protein
MADNIVNFTINLGGNAYAGVVKVDDAFTKLTANVKKSLSFMDKLSDFSFKFNMITDAVSKFRDMVGSAIEPGVKFDYSLRELSAIAQVTGRDLDDIGSKARNLAKAFGGEAAGYVESFKDVIGSLGETFSDSTALDMMGKNIATLSKLMGGNAKAAANALTTAMLQYGVDLKNPIEAAKEATRMMNVMQAAANVGGSEVSDTAEALRQSGLMAKQSGVSFEQLNASLEALAKGKVVASEAGVAMRNMLLSMNTLSGAPQKTAEALRAYGVDIRKVADPTVKFSDRLRELKKIQSDAVLMESVFMKANIASASTLLENVDAIDEYTDAVTGTNAAVEGAATIMESYQERQSRIRAQFEDLKITIFNATGSLGIWTDTIFTSLVPLSQLLPLLTGVWSGVAMATRFINQKTKALWKNTAALWANITSQGTFMMISFATVGVMGVVTAAATAMWTAITGPIGLIVLGIAAVVSVFVLLWNKCEGFRKVVFGVWEVIKAVFQNIWTVVKSIAKPLFDFITFPYRMLWKVVKWTFYQIKDAITSVFAWVKSAVSAVGDFFVSIWGNVVGTVSRAWGWITDKLGAVGGWIKKHLIDPIGKAFSEIWKFISGIFDKIFDKLTKIIAPIRELWNKIFPKDAFRDVASAYAAGAQRGTESWRKSQEKKNNTGNTPSADNTSVLGAGDANKNKNHTQTRSVIPTSPGAAAGSSAGGVKQVNITLDAMMKNVAFNGSLTENRAELESKLQEMLARILAMAETAV